MTTTSDVPLQDLTPSSPQPGTPAAAFQPGTLHTPIATPSHTLSTQGFSQAANTRPSTPTTLQSVAPQNHQATGFPPMPSSPSTPGPSQDSSQTAPTPATESWRKKWKEQLNNPWTWISIVLAIILSIPSWASLRGSTLALQVWSALNDLRRSCYADRDHGVFSQICNDTLAHSITAPPVKWEEELQERSLFDFWCSYITFLVVPMVLIFIGSYLSQGRAPHCHDGSATTWADYYHRSKTRLPFSRPTWVPSTAKVTSRLVFVFVGLGFFILNFVDPYMRMMIVLAIATIPVFWCVTDNSIAMRRWSSEKAFRAAV